ncbi:hypothetical protein [Nonomuraea sp. NPDC046570]|uniref:hypothetical protein n=1 Tax=Nonomuraea sp. NPDC046570 TaxID=3155255 RepID=UPI00340AC35D
MPKRDLAAIRLPSWGRVVPQDADLVPFVVLDNAADQLLLQGLLGLGEPPFFHA